MKQNVQYPAQDRHQMNEDQWKEVKKISAKQSKLSNNDTLACRWDWLPAFTQDFPQSENGHVKGEWLLSDDAAKESRVSSSETGSVSPCL